MTSSFNIRQPISKEEFLSMYDLRWRLLRKPWNQPKGSEIDELDKKKGESFPFIAIINDMIVGTARFHKNSEHEGQIRYLAVDKQHSKKGIGKSLIKHIESFAKNHRITFIVLNARETAADFFKKLGYKIEKKGPIIYNVIEHYVMSKTIE